MCFCATFGEGLSPLPFQVGDRFVCIGAFSGQPLLARAAQYLEQPGAAALHQLAQLLCVPDHALRHRARGRVGPIGRRFACGRLHRLGAKALSRIAFSLARYGIPVPVQTERAIRTLRGGRYQRDSQTQSNRTLRQFFLSLYRGRR